MADQNFMDLASKTASGITGTDYMMLVNNSEAYKALVNDVAEAILGKLTSKSFSGLETTAKNVIGALNELNSKITYDYYDEGKNYNLDNLFINSAESPGEIIRYFRNLNLGTNTGAELPINATTAIIIGDFQIIFGYQTSVYYRYRWGDWSGWKEI